MITKFRIVNFRQIEDQTVDLSPTVVFVGPNNGGKTTFLQALSLFSISITAWKEKRLAKKNKPSKRRGIAINLDELINIPVTEFKELWKDLIVREGDKNKAGKPITKNIHIEIHAEGFSEKLGPWQVGFEYDYSRDSLIYVRLTNDQHGNLYEFPDALLEERIGYLPSVAGLKPMEDKLEIGSILRHLGNGNTADVLRNVCYLLYDKEDKRSWNEFCKIIENIFKIQLNPPRYVQTSGLLKMTYDENGKKDMDLSSLGSGSKQAILLFAYILAFPNTIHLLDEPDAHLEVVRQANIYDQISDISKRNNSQLIIASHSESVLNRAYPKDQVVSSIFGKFNKVTNPSFISSSLREIGYEEFIIAEQRPRILYFEGTTDLDFLKQYANILGLHELLDLIEKSVYPKAVGNDVKTVFRHFRTLKEFLPHLKGYALFDRLNRDFLDTPPDLIVKQWTRNKIENYLPLPDAIKKYALSHTFHEPLWGQNIEKIITENTPPRALSNLSDDYWMNTKITDNYLDPIFKQFFDEVGLPRSTMDKSKYYQLASYLNPEDVAPEIKETLLQIKKHLQVT